MVGGAAAGVRWHRQKCLVGVVALALAAACVDAAIVTYWLRPHQRSKFLGHAIVKNQVGVGMSFPGVFGGDGIVDTAAVPDAISPKREGAGSFPAQEVAQEIHDLLGGRRSGMEHPVFPALQPIGGSQEKAASPFAGMPPFPLLPQDGSLADPFEPAGGHSPFAGSPMFPSDRDGFVGPFGSEKPFGPPVGGGPFAGNSTMPFSSPEGGVMNPFKIVDAIAEEVFNGTRTSVKTSNFSFNSTGASSIANAIASEVAAIADAIATGPLLENPTRPSAGTDHQSPLAGGPVFPSEGALSLPGLFGGDSAAPFSKDGLLPAAIAESGSMDPFGVNSTFPMQVLGIIEEEVRNGTHISIRTSNFTFNSSVAEAMAGKIESEAEAMADALATGAFGQDLTLSHPVAGLGPVGAPAKETTSPDTVDAMPIASDKHKTEAAFFKRLA